MFKLYDNYEGDMELLGSGTIEDLKPIANERIKDTDGECYLIVEDQLGNVYLMDGSIRRK